MVEQPEAKEILLLPTRHSSNDLVNAMVASVYGRLLISIR
jgi:hypothetical protein